MKELNGIYILHINYPEASDKLEAVSWRCSVKALLQNSPKENFYWSLFLIKLQAPGLQLY